MSKKKLVPKLRFERFEASESWIIREIIDYVDVRDGTHGSPKYQEKGHPFVTSKNVSDGYINYEDIEYISTEDFNQINKRSKVDKNDILMGMIGTIGNIALVREEPDYAIKNVALIKESNRIDYLYLYHLLQSPNIKKQLDDAMDGGTQKFIALNRIRALNITIPDKSEQNKIGAFFEKIDEMIQLQQSKVDKIKDIKSAYLSEMFPKEGEKYPKKRFEGFTEPWKKSKFNEITEYITSSLSANNVLTKGKYELYDANELIGYTNSSGQAQEYVTIIKDGSGVGRVRLLPKNSNFIGTMGAIINKEQADVHYIYAYLQQFNFTEFITGATVPHVYYRDYGESIDYHPAYDEQVRIGKLFKNLDNQILIEEEKLAKLEKLKQAYLNDMFV